MGDRNHKRLSRIVVPRLQPLRDLLRRGNQSPPRGSISEAGSQRPWKSNEKDPFTDYAGAGYSSPIQFQRRDAISFQRRDAISSLDGGVFGDTAEHEDQDDEDTAPWLCAPRPRSRLSTSHLCDKCQRINFSALAQQLRNGDPWKAVVKINLGRRLNGTLPQTNDCQLCQLFARSRLSHPRREKLPWQRASFIAAQKEQDREEEDFELVALMFELGGYHHPCLVVVPRGYMIPLHQFGRRRIKHSESEHFERHVTEDKLLAIVDFKPDKSTEPLERDGVCSLPLKVDGQLNFVTLRSWLENCVTNHQKCRSRSHTRTEMGHSLFVIDCKMRALVSPPEDCVYAALSYVWGPEQSPEHDILHTAPQVVRDAMFVTLGLGLRYLWVDRLCMPLDSKQKHQEIQRMDMIYSGAEVTIVDAAGHDANRGLPGVGALRRSGQASAMSSDGTEIVSCLHDPVALVRESPWATRAWTLQEGILSRRCLIFTEEQAYFECWEGRRVELVHPIDLGFMFPLRIDPLRQTSAFSRDIEISLDHEINVINQLLLHITNYTSRALTYDSDSLSAILGVLNAAKTSNFTHHFGIPFNLDDGGGNFMKVLGTWFHEQKTSTIRRRAAFPSWSYVGYAGTVQFPPPSILHFNFHAAEELHFESTDGRQIGLNSLITLPDDEKRLYTTVSFNATVLKAEKAELVQPSSNEHFILEHLSVNLTRSPDWWYVYIKSAFGPSEGQYWLIVTPKDGFVERIGVLVTQNIHIDDVTEQRIVKLR